MTNRMSVEERYHRDPMFHSVVTALEAAIMNLNLTPTEIREAATYAAIRVESRSLTSLNHEHILEHLAVQKELERKKEKETKGKK